MKKLIRTGAAVSALLMAASTAGIGIAGAADTTTTTASTPLTPGTLALETAPSFVFGNTNTISTAAATYTSSQSPSGLGVSNPGVVGTWSVTASASPFTSGAFTLTNAALTLTSGGSGVFKSDTNSPTADNPTMAGSAAISGTAAEVESATSTSTSPIGVGEFDYTYSPTAATLAVPAQTILPGTYESTITWTLASTSSSATTPAT
ncbi:WxL domain-containing protein [Companilactobacillus ginsenosidimutans]|uniref:WxL domain-containing protein n=1 Tax=Companilactobacillus ginsenosidimutans TaxID=1007676 RepID=A0A0H4QXQ8_9LACO|nr:WxL domain-containing protein [Companilactobacillus ginsenosidimutans]AKP66260.1 hypothetical protein ABM34_00985 [Companilactobacillus ginsenosidimutans]